MLILPNAFITGMSMRSRNTLVNKIASSLLFLVSTFTFAVTVTDQHGEFSIDKVPKRIVVLEFSFADALAAVNVSPVGIADDNDPDRLLPAVRSQLHGWQSVGTRAQPSLEVISSLKPDLIIADVDRHAGVYQDLIKIAPTLLLSSRRESYQSNLQSAHIIAKVIGKEKEMLLRLQQHQQLMQQYASKLKPLRKQFIQFAVARENGLFAHGHDSYAGGVIESLGLMTPHALSDDKASRQISLEQLLALNPDYLVIGDYSKINILQQWQNQPLWSILTSVRNNHLYHVDGNLWSRCRGIFAAEQMADDLLQLLN
jgi:ferric citrate transport system substrate-binding protein